MRKSFKCLFILCFFSQLISAQTHILKDKSDFPRKNILKAFYYGPNTGGYNLAFERIIRKKISFQTGLRYKNYKAGTFSFHSYNDIYLQPEIRYYLSKKGAPQGFYLGLNAYMEYLRIAYLNHDSNSPVKKQIFYGFFLGKELHLGYQWIIRKRFSIDVNAGIRYINRIGPVHIFDYHYDGTIMKTRSYVDDNAGYYTPQSLLPSFSFMVGYAF
jgi:hypothetical protein